MLNVSDKQGSSSSFLSKNKQKVANNQDRLAIDIHAMPKTSESSLRVWFVIGAVTLGIIVFLFIIFN